MKVYNKFEHIHDIGIAKQRKKCPLTKNMAEQWTDRPETNAINLKIRKIYRNAKNGQVQTVVRKLKNHFLCWLFVRQSVGAHFLLIAKC